MFENRISDYLTHSETDQTRFASELCPAFVACPVAMFAGHASQQAYVADVYRAARELTEAQLQRPARVAVCEFSLN